MNPLLPKNNSSSTSLSNLSNISEANVEKPESTEKVKVKLCDFSFSQIMIPGQPILGMMGTVAYSGIFIDLID
jgi:hypothetical protein